MRDNPVFSSRDVALMSVFGCLSSLTTLTTAFIPAPLPGLYGLIAIPVGTILLLVVREVVGKTGAATFTQFVSGLVSTILPGGPPVRWMIIPTWVVGGVVVDVIFHIAKRRRNKRLVYTVTGLIYNIPGDLLLYWSFSFFLGWTWPLMFFLYGFAAIHAALGGLAGLFTPEILKRVKPVADRTAAPKGGGTGYETRRSPK